MSNYSLVESNSFGSENWCLKLQPSYKYGLLTGLSNGEIRLLDWNSGQSLQKIKASETSINDLKVINSDFAAGHLVSSASIDAVKFSTLGRILVSPKSTTTPTPLLFL